MNHGERKGQTSRELVGLVPAGGQANRLSPLPCSKELYPVGFRPATWGEGVRPKVAIHYLLERLRLAGVSRAYIILRPGKWDIPAYLNDGRLLDMHLAYLMMDRPFGVPFTLEQAYPFARDAMVAFGFPDILFKPRDAFAKLLARQRQSGADLVLGLFPAHQPHKMDLVEIDDEGRIRGIQIKPSRTDLLYTWIIAVWTPAFTGFMHDYVAVRSQAGSGTGREVFVGDVIQTAIDEKVKIDKVLFDQGDYLDIGTPEDLVTAVQSGY